jgi:hypothetical protein
LTNCFRNRNFMQPMCSHQVPKVFSKVSKCSPSSRCVPQDFRNNTSFFNLILFGDGSTSMYITCKGREIPNFYMLCFLCKCLFATTTFIIYMSMGVHDIFVLVLNFINVNWQPKQMTIEIVCIHLETHYGKILCNLDHSSLF